MRHRQPSLLDNPDAAGEGRITVTPQDAYRVRIDYTADLCDRFKAVCGSHNSNFEFGPTVRYVTWTRHAGTHYRLFEAGRFGRNRPLSVPYGQGTRKLGADEGESLPDAVRRWLEAWFPDAVIEIDGRRPTKMDSRVHFEHDTGEDPRL